jgi:hypothetical protein
MCAMVMRANASRLLVGEEGQTFVKSPEVQGIREAVARMLSQYLQLNHPAPPLVPPTGMRCRI